MYKQHNLQCIFLVAWTNICARLKPTNFHLKLRHRESPATFIAYICYICAFYAQVIFFVYIQIKGAWADSLFEGRFLVGPQSRIMFRSHALVLQNKRYPKHLQPFYYREALKKIMYTKKRTITRKQNTGMEAINILAHCQGK